MSTAAHAVSYAAELREAGQLRAVSRAMAGGDPQEIAEASVADMQAARDRGLPATDEPSTDLLDFIAEADEDDDWVIPGVLARWDRMIVTGGEAAANPCCCVSSWSVRPPGSTPGRRPGSGRTRRCSSTWRTRAVRLGRGSGRWPGLRRRWGAHRGRADGRGRPPAGSGPQPWR
ncbi:hypothetical protein [Streptomyces sp. Ncost-T10-10d]|uniref:hypothetical protein n=1 Tax=Streptomyces sp. Ncost-T10-10d TaxID=1839774 RepID=UPI00114C87F8|nr:hypothetical protein [Streptomyces sp. Ncost-T10-10d]